MTESGHLGKMFRRFLQRKQADQKFQESVKKGTKEEGKKDKSPPKKPQTSPSTTQQAEKIVKKQQQKKASNIEKAKRIEEEEAEEFEPVAVQGARPALCSNKREAKLKWKKEDDLSKKCDGMQNEDSSSAESPSTPSNEGGTKELTVEPLKDAVAELALENRKLKDTVDRLRKRVARRDKKIEKLQKELKSNASSKQTTSSSSSGASEKGGDIVAEIKKELEVAKAQLAKQIVEGERTKIEMEKLLGKVREGIGVKKKTPLSLEGEDVDVAHLNEVTSASATRILEVLKRNQLLERALSPKQTDVLYNFFTSGAAAKPTTEVLTLLDLAIGTGMETLISRPQDLDDPIDNQMRHLLVDDRLKAKSILLEVMLADPKFVPPSWGGKVLVAKSMRASAVDSKKIKEDVSVYIRPNQSKK